MQKIYPFLWFDTQAEEAVNFYTSLFPNSKIGKVTRYEGEGAKISGRPEGSVMSMGFEINGQQFGALNGGPLFKFNESVSFVINCKGQEEIDKYWDALTADGGQESQCGWLKDKFGVSWQVVPDNWDEIFINLPPDKLQKVMQAMFQMKKLDIKKLEDAGK